MSDNTGIQVSAMSIEKMIAEIHEVIVKHKPAEDELVDAAVKVCQIRYSDKEWGDLSAAIGELIGVLQKAGVRFNNPRIDE